MFDKNCVWLLLLCFFNCAHCMSYVTWNCFVAASACFRRKWSVEDVDFDANASETEIIIRINLITLSLSIAIFISHSKYCERMIYRQMIRYEITVQKMFLQFAQNYKGDAFWDAYKIARSKLGLFLVPFWYANTAMQTSGFQELEFRFTIPCKFYMPFVWCREQYDTHSKPIIDNCK